MPDGPFPPAASLDLGSPPSSVLLAATTPSTPSRWTPVSLVPRYPSGHRFASLPARADGFWSPGLELIYPGSPSRPCRWEDAGSPKFPSLPCRDMPRSRTPVASRPVPPPRRSRCCLPCRRARRLHHDYNPFSGLNAAAYLLAPPGSAPRIAPTHARFATGPPAGFDRVGLPAAILGRAPTGKRWRVSCNTPIPSPRASLGAIPCRVRSRRRVHALAGAASWMEGRSGPPLSGRTVTRFQVGGAGNAASTPLPLGSLGSSARHRISLSEDGDSRARQSSSLT
jgi:hypothetical protein